MVHSFEYGLERFAQICQVIAGRALDWSEPPDPTALAGAFATIESPMFEWHALAMERALFCFAVGLALTTHRNFHHRFSAADKTVIRPELKPVRDPGGRLLVRESVYRWATGYREEFLAAHSSPAQRARRLIDASEGRGWSVDELAAAIGIGRRTLERQFRQEIGVSIREYRTRQRLIGAVRQLHATDECVEAVALGAGWHSKKGLYNALSDVAGRTPCGVRQMSVPEIDSLMSKLNACGSSGALAPGSSTLAHCPPHPRDTRAL
jgi:AraC-like DNA-binding protein